MCQNIFELEDKFRIQIKCFAGTNKKNVFEIYSAINNSSGEKRIVTNVLISDSILTH